MLQTLEAPAALLCTSPTGLPHTVENPSAGTCNTIIFMNFNVHSIVVFDIPAAHILH
jgi:hypothetical protein